MKGPGDTPQENQKLWFDSLLGANIDVEICKVVDENDANTVITARKSIKSKANSKKKTPASTISHKRKKLSASSESEDEDYDQMDVHSDDDNDALELPSKRRKTVTGVDLTAPWFVDPDGGT